MVVDISFLVVNPGVVVVSLLLLQVEETFLVAVASTFFQVHSSPFLVHSLLVLVESFKVYPSVDSRDFPLVHLLQVLLVEFHLHLEVPSHLVVP